MRRCGNGGQGLGQLAVAVDNDGDEEAIDWVVVVSRVGEGGAQGYADGRQAVSALA